MIEPTLTAPSDTLRERFRKLREKEFPWTAETTYLNNASIGPIPERTRRRIDAFTAKRTAPYLLPDGDLQQILRDARAAAARLLGAHTSEIGLATNTSYGITLAARALPLRMGDVVLVPDREFPANVYPWLMLRDKGVHVEFAPNTAEGWPDEEFLLERLEDPRVRVLAISFVQFSNGYRADLGRLSEACREHDVFLVVDAIQGLGQVPLDVRKVRIDVLACGGQKWLLSPWGAGFVYVRQDLLEVIEPVVCGWMAFQGTDDFTRLTDYNPDFHLDGRRLEMVTLPFQDMAGMIESLTMLMELGVEDITAYTRMLREPLVRCAELGEFTITSPLSPEHDSAIVCVAPKEPAEAFHHLKRANVVCSMREGAIRLSPHCYNTVREMERVAAILGGHAP
ncbi:MAG: aminotransferase class V-fold PLP-dependent enzyme [Gemmatimonadetes bacterium]|nr:aminotransferase class V-fold PLP-dependent enzyme [Gemmatimonadota bacterium]